jgi:hypothetical protein
MPSGGIFCTHPQRALVAHVGGHSTGSIGIALADDHDLETPAPASLAAARCLVIGLAPGRMRLGGHRDLAPTTRPGRLPGEHLGLIADGLRPHHRRGAPGEHPRQADAGHRAVRS